MRAERDDAPYYLQTKREKPWRVVAIIAIGSAITLSAITLLPGPAPIKTPPLANVQPTTYEPQQQNYSTPKQTEHSKEDKSRQAEVKTTPRLQYIPEQRIEKQTSFNDSNYIPKSATNTVSYQPTQPIQTKAPKEKKLEIVVIGEERRLKDYCPFREGSIEQRNCRMRADLESRNRN